MEEIKYVPLATFQIEPTLDDKFWLEKIKRSIDEDRKSTRLNSSHVSESRMPSSA